ncbi:MAG: TIGR03619 family F420-dependent LLM class oxidoreductase [Micromonosporaceae bacterium]
MKFGVPLGLVRPAIWKDLAVEADRLGFESVWMPEHLVFTTDLSLATYPGTETPAISPATPLFDAPAYLCALAAVTTGIRLGTAVYLFGLRHPFVAARAFATLDQVSGGRAIAGVGVGWYQGEWVASGLDFASRGRRLDEALQVARLLWERDTAAWDGDFFSFPEVAFEPKPVQRPLPVHTGGESPAALRRAATSCEGWIGMTHTVESARPRVSPLRHNLAAAGRADAPFEITVHAEPCPGPGDVAVWEGLGVHRLIVRPWNRTRDAISALRVFAATHGLAPREDKAHGTAP